ncbi:hypothetical protein KPH14_009101 [Odynerus spinipes]|uniref:Uncharacterized protein n=1 Tax=Odynerus spinipes TaxID=1348599 RepID=A0AAD9VQB3_9HYME|nr:hypothetical protein KPH14_009101 [Odynerus spinipes]
MRHPECRKRGKRKIPNKKEKSRSYSLCLSLPPLEMSMDKGVGTFSEQMSSFRSGLIPRSAFLPTFMYLLPIVLGEPSPNKDVMNLMFAGSS